MGEGWEGVMFPAPQEASGSLRTASTKHRGIAQRREKLGPAEAGLAQYRENRAGREIVPMNGHGGWDHPGVAGNDATPFF
jgi:hypothetical protein